MGEKTLRLGPNCYEMTATVCPSGHYGRAIMISYTEINKAVSQLLSLLLDLTFNLWISVT